MRDAVGICETAQSPDSDLDQNTLSNRRVGRVQKFLAAVASAVALVVLADPANADTTIDLIWQTTGTDTISGVNTSTTITFDVILTAGPNGVSSSGITIDYSAGFGAGTIALVSWACAGSSHFPTCLSHGTNPGSQIQTMSAVSLSPSVGTGLASGQSVVIGTATFHKVGSATGTFEFTVGLFAVTDGIFDNQLPGVDIGGSTTFNSAFLTNPIPTPTPTATPTPLTFDIDHFSVYRAAGPTPPPSFETVTLRDQFNEEVVDLGALDLFLVPADKNGEGLQDSISHLACNPIPNGNPGFPWVVVTNQFGEATLNVGIAKELCVPTEKLITPGTVTIEHFKCYEASGASVNAPAALVDQFQSWGGLALDPFLLCNPADKNGEGVVNFDDHLVCYGVTPAGSTLGIAVPIANQIYPHVNIDLFNPFAVCVPSLKVLPEPGVLLSLGSGLVLLGWLDQRRRRRASDRPVEAAGKRPTGGRV